MRLALEAEAAVLDVNIKCMTHVGPWGPMAKEPYMLYTICLCKTIIEIIINRTRETEAVLCSGDCIP